MNTICPYCKSEKTDIVVIKFGSETEQRVNLCRGCKRIFKAGEKI